MIVKRMRLGRIACMAAAAALVLTGCGDQSSSDPAGSKDARPDDSAATESGSGVADALSDYTGLCSWVSPDDLEAIFGEPMDAVGSKECRIVASGDGGAGPIFHVRLDQQAGFDELSGRLEANQASSGFTICDSESSRWQGMRIERRVTCPDSADQEFEPTVMLEVGPGRVLATLPFSTDSKQAAEDASQQFVEILKALAPSGQGQPVINEVLPGSWLEIYNPGSKPVDLSGAVLRGYDDFDDGLSATMDVPDGSTVGAGDRLVLDISSLQGLSGDTPLIELSGSDGRFMDVMDLSLVDGGGEVVRRDGDGGLYCSFGSAQVTKGAPNPRGCD